MGGSAARGPFLSDAVRNLLGTTRSADERALGWDAEYSRNHWLVRGEGVWTRWELPTLAVPLSASSAFVEGTYKVWPGVFLAARADTLRFSTVTGTTLKLPWDAPVSRIEVGAGFSLQRNLLLKASFQHNSRDLTVGDPSFVAGSAQLGAVQLVYWF